MQKNGATLPSSVAFTQEQVRSEADAKDLQQAALPEELTTAWFRSPRLPQTPGPRKEEREEERESSAAEQMCRKVRPCGGSQDSFKFLSFPGADHGKLCRFLSGLLSLSGEGMSSKENWDLQTIAMPSTGGI